MKKVLTFAAIALFFSACNSTAKFKPQIEELAKTWDATTSQVGDFTTSVKTEQSNWANAATAMTVAPEAMAKWDAAGKAKYAEIQAAAQNSSAGISGIATELDGFVSSWTEKSASMKALTDGLAAGKIEGDVKAQLADLTAANTDATSKLGEWKTKFEEVKAGASKAQQMFADFMAASSAAPDTAGKK